MGNVIEIDCRGLACPKPVLNTKKALEENPGVQLAVFVDNKTAVENVSRFARNQGCSVEVTERPDGLSQVLITSSSEAKPTSIRVKEEKSVCSNCQQVSVVYIASRCMGIGSDELGEKLMRGFMRTLIDCEPLPWRVILINSGVNLSSVDEEGVESLKMLEGKGVEILSCGTCLQHFGLENKLAVGKATNMFEVIESLNNASKIISPI